MAVVSLRQTVKNGKLILHSTTLKGDRDLRSTVSWCGADANILPYIVSRLSETIIYYDEAGMDKDEAADVLFNLVEEDLVKKREKLLTQLAQLQTNLGLVRAELAKVKGGAV